MVIQLIDSSSLLSEFMNKSISIKIHEMEQFKTQKNKMNTIYIQEIF